MLEQIDANPLVSSIPEGPHVLSLSDTTLGIGPSSKSPFYIPKSGGTAAYIDPAITINFRNDSIGSNYQRRCLYWARTLTRHHKIH